MPPVAQRIAKEQNKQVFRIMVRGRGRYQNRVKQVTVCYTPGRAKRYGDKLFATQHFEFWTKGAGPISETGYRSHFVNGTRQQLGLTNQNIRKKVIKMAEALAADYKGVFEHGRKG